MRPEGWELRLTEAIERARGMPFQWGVHDCATWASDVRRAMTGEDAAAVWRGRYRTAAGYARVMRRLGWESLADGATAVLGPAIRPTMAQRGDLVLEGDAFGICVGAEALFLAPEGLTALPMSAIALAWRV